MRTTGLLRILESIPSYLRKKNKISYREAKRHGRKRGEAVEGCMAPSGRLEPADSKFASIETTSGISIGLGSSQATKGELRYRIREGSVFRVGLCG